LLSFPSGVGRRTGSENRTHTMRCIDVLIVCTGNICRSPMGEALLRSHLAARGVDARVHSAGTLAWGGPATGNAGLVMRERGLSLEGHLSRSLTDRMIEDADLVLGMTRDHVWRATRGVADATDRTFLVGELRRLGGAAGPRLVADGETVRAWAARAAALRPPGRAGAVGRAGDEVADPVGEPLAVYRRTAERLDRDLVAIAALLAP
jgi:protein-tyrosine-phosphatase